MRNVLPVLVALGSLNALSSCGGGGAAPVDAMDAGVSCTLPNTAIAQSGTTSGDNTGGVGRGAGSCQAALGGGTGPESYFVLRPTIDGEIIVTVDSEADIGVYVQEACGDASSELACVDDQVGGDAEELTFAVENGRAYYIVVDGFSDLDTGPFTVTVTSRDTGGACAAAPMFPASGTATGTTVGGTDVFQTLLCSGGATAEAVYQYVVPGADTTSGTLLLTLTSTADLGLSVRSDCARSLSELGCEDYGFAGVEETLRLPVRGGSPLWFFVDGYAAGDEGEFTLAANYEVATCGDGVLSGLDEECDPPEATTCLPTCKWPPGEWSCADNFRDDDEDGFPDCADSECASQPICAPGPGALGSPCTLPSDCAATMNDPVCFTELDNAVGRGLCTERCSEADPCGEAGASCMNLGFAQVCAPACSEALPCRAGQICVAGTCAPFCLLDSDCPLTGYCDPLHPGKCHFPEVGFCTDGIDNNHNSYVDCGDLACIGDPACPPINEVEPNDAVATANTYVAAFTGVITMHDSDFINVAVTAGATIDVRTEDPNNGDQCFGLAEYASGIPTAVDIMAPDGSTVASNTAVSTANFCSRASVRGAVAGTYTIKVAASPDAETEFIYRLAVTVTP